MHDRLFKENIINSINHELADLENKSNIVMWGLGNYAEKFVIYTNVLKYNIRFFVDSIRKGVFLGREVITPQQLHWENVDAVIITAPYRFSEIELELRNQYKYYGLVIKPDNDFCHGFFFEFDSKTVLEIDDHYKGILEKNKVFYKAHEGNKCFILGCGPSLNKYDLNKITNSVVMAVNDFYKMDSDIAVDYYVAADPIYFDKKIYNDYGIRFFSGIKGIEKNNKNIKYWFPIRFRDSLISFGQEWPNVNYFFDGRLWESRIDYGIDFTKRIIVRWSVIQYCIQLAIYMGVSEIYLLGCEETGVLGYLRNVAEEGDCEYAYTLPSDEVKTINDYLSNSRVYQVIDGYSKILKGYEEMNELCINNSTKLYTCADKTLVRGLEYCDFNDAIT